MKVVGNRQRWGELSLSFLVAAALFSVYASTFNVPSGTTDTQTGLNETDRTYKQGDGTLVVNGSSSSKRMTVSAGTLKFSGGTATIADSTATTAYSDAMFVQNGGNTIIADGAVVTAKDGSYVDVNNGTFTVTNATFDATGISGHVMNAFSGNNSDCWIVIETNGVLKTNVLRPTGTATAAMKDRVGVRLNRGGELRLKNFFVDGVGNNRYGRIYFDGGHLYRTETAAGRLFNADTERDGWVKKQTVPTILEGGFYLYTVGETTISVGFDSGAEHDGGAHFMSGNLIRWYGDNSYNGGTWLESTGGGILDVRAGDTALGAIPAQPTTNIWVTGSNHTLYNEGNVVTIHSNRMVFIKNGVRLRTGSKNRLVFTGEIHGEIAAGNAEPTGTALHVRGDWNGTTVLDPGAGHTNDVGHLVNYGRLEVTSGVTRVVSSSSGTGDGTALLYTSGNNSSLNDYRGHLIVNGGTLITVPQASEDNRFLIAKQYAQTEITNGGKIDMPNACYVNGLQSPASLTIADGGEMKVVTFQFANATTNCTVDLKSGGRLTTSEFWCNGAECTVNIDGGVIGRHGSKQDVAFGLDGGAARWTGVDVFVKEGGVTFDVPSNNLWVKLPLQSAAAQDAGLCKTGAGVLVVQTNLAYNGSTTVSGGTMQMRGHNLLPQTTLKLENGGIAAFSLYETGNWETYTHTEQTFKRIEGNGRINYSKNVRVTESIAPSVNGQIHFEWACDINGDFEIQGNAEGCGKIYSQRDTLDLTKLTLKVADFSTFDAGKAKFSASMGAGYYQILKVASAASYSGKFNLPADWPKEWLVEYSATGAYLHCLKGTLVILR